MPPAMPATLGEFRVHAILGEGGSGIVYDATWGPRRVALKVLQPRVADRERVLAQFLSEAQRLQAIHHPSVVKVLAVGQLPDARPYLAMERLEGETLSSVLSRGRLPLAPALAMFGELCAAVHALHAQGLVHRDLKPENVFVVAGRHPVLLDFGIAKEIEAPASTTTSDGGIRGTPAYMAPERFFGQPAGVATDIYELAVTLYAMLAGRLPWDELGDPEARLSPRSLRDLVEVPAELDVEIRRALSTRAQNRPPTAVALRDAVQHAAGAAATGAPEPADTARMLPARDGIASDRRDPPDPGATPLAWAPAPRTEAPTSRPPHRARTALIVGVATLAIATTGVLAWRRASAPDTPRVTTPATVPSPSPEPRAITTGPSTPTTADDPWAPRPTPRAELSNDGPSLTIDAAQAELADALGTLPADTTVVISSVVGPLRRVDALSPVFEALASSARLRAFAAAAPPCVTDLVRASEWFAYGAASLEQQEQGTLILRGRWIRADVEKCFGAITKPRTMPDGARLLEMPELGWIAFPTDHSVYVSVRQDLTAAQVHASTRRRTGLTDGTRKVLAALPKSRALTFAVADARIDGDAQHWPKDTLPLGTRAGGSIALDEGVLRFALALRPPSEPDAIRIATVLDTEVAKLFVDAPPNVAKAAVVRDGRDVRLDGHMATMFIGILVSSL